MAKTKVFEFDKPLPVKDDEDEETLARIDEGLRDAKTGRTFSIAQVRKLLPKWITGSSSPKDR
jgi:predicted transcriptional regulator